MGIVKPEENTVYFDKVTALSHSIVLILLLSFSVNSQADNIIANPISNIDQPSVDHCLDSINTDGEIESKEVRIERVEAIFDTLIQAKAQGVSDIIGVVSLFFFLEVSTSLFTASVGYASTYTVYNYNLAPLKKTLIDDIRNKTDVCYNKEELLLAMLTGRELNQSQINTRHAQTVMHYLTSNYPNRYPLKVKNSLIKNVHSIGSLTEQKTVSDARNTGVPLDCLEYAEHLVSTENVKKNQHRSSHVLAQCFYYMEY